MHPTILETAELRWPDEAACGTSARHLAAACSGLDAVVTLEGDLGAGKTTFVRHLLRAMGVQGRIKSPTYAIAETYTLEGGRTVVHCDLYRMQDEREWEEAGLRDLFAGPGLKLVEWPERAGDRLPGIDLTLQLRIAADEARAVRAVARSQTGQVLLKALHE